MNPSLISPNMFMLFWKEQKGMRAAGVRDPLESNRWGGWTLTSAAKPTDPKQWKLRDTLKKLEGVAPLIADPPPLKLHQGKIHLFSKMTVNVEPFMGF